MSKLYVPEGYKSDLSIHQTQSAIKKAGNKDTVEETIKAALVALMKF